MQRFRDMERRGNITLVQRFGGIAWFSLVYVCNDNKEDNNCGDKDESNPLLIQKMLNRGSLATLGGQREKFRLC